MVTLGSEIQIIENVKETEEVDLSRSGIKIFVGDSRTELKKFPDGYFQCCITSPPYWGLRDYNHEGQIGAESTIDEYINNLMIVFKQVHRVLRDDGTLWLNIGDGYTSGGRKRRAPDKKNKGREMYYRPDTPPGLKRKDLLGLPWKVAFALQEFGWYLRADIIWNKPNCQPESVKDRPTKSHEYLFLFTKSERYYYDNVAIMEKTNGGEGTKNRRSVWNINTEGYNGAHFAVFPTRLVENCVKAGSKAESYVLDPFLGSGTVAIVCQDLHRNCIGIEKSSEYAEMARERISAAQPHLPFEI